MINTIKHERMEAVTQDWTDVAMSELSLPSGYDSPFIIAAIQTFNGPDTAQVRMRPLHGGAIQVKIEEERSADQEVSHVEETVGHIAFKPLWIHDDEDNEIGYASFLDITQPAADSWMPLPVPTTFSVDDSVVFAQVLTFNGTHPVHPRIRKEHPSSGAPGFYLKLEEWPTYDRRHIAGHIQQSIRTSTLRVGSYLRGIVWVAWTIVGQIAVYGPAGAFERKPTVLRRGVDIQVGMWPRSSFGEIPTRFSIESFSHTVRRSTT